MIKERIIHYKYITLIAQFFSLDHQFNRKSSIIGQFVWEWWSIYGFFDVAWIRQRGEFSHRSLRNAGNFITALLITRYELFIVYNTKEKFILCRHKIRLWTNWSEYVSVSASPSLVFEDHCKSSYSIHSREPHHQTPFKNKQLSV